MKPTHLIPWTLVLMTACSSPITQNAGRQTEHTFQADLPVSLPYLLYLPEGYGQSTKRWPLVLFLHGSGERGTDLMLVKRHGPPKRIEEGASFPFVLASPQCPAGRWWSVDHLDALLRHLCATLEIDTDRVSVTGLSMGGFGTWALALEFPDRFAAIAPVCGGGTAYRANLLRNLPVWAFHGAKDPVIALSYSVEMVDAINRSGGNARLTVYPEAGHDSYTETYAREDLYAWLLAQRRSSAPR
jgi:predicted peptidase